MPRKKPSKPTPLTKEDFNEAMQMIARSFDKVATKDDIKYLAGRMDSFDERLARDERVQEHMLKVLESIEGRLREMADHEERITQLEKKIFELEQQLQQVK